MSSTTTISVGGLPAATAAALSDILPDSQQGTLTRVTRGISAEKLFEALGLEPVAQAYDIGGHLVMIPNGGGQPYLLPTALIEQVANKGQPNGYMGLDSAGGGTLAGPLTLSGDPTNGLQATTKEYVDRHGFYDAAAAPGVTLDGVTDCGAAFNTWAASLPDGAVIGFKGSLATSITIILQRGMTFVGQDGMLNGAGGIYLHTITQIIGLTATLSPVVQIYGGAYSGGGLQYIGVSRPTNVTPAAGAVGVAIGYMKNSFCLRMRCYGHDIGLAVTPYQGNQAYNSIGCAFDHCEFYGNTTDQVFLRLAPEMTFIDCGFGRGAVGYTVAPQSMVHIDDQGVNTGAGTTNTLSFIRSQFNPTLAPQSHLYISNYGSPDGWILFDGCYAASATIGFINIDPSCTVVRRIQIAECNLAPGTTVPLVNDPASVLNNFKMTGGFYTAVLNLNGVGIQVESCNFNGASSATLTSVSGHFIGNGVQSVSLAGTMAGFFFSGNEISGAFTNTSAGSSTILGPNSWSMGANSIDLAANGNGLSQESTQGDIRLIYASNTSGAVHVGTAAPGISLDVTTNLASGAALTQSYQSGTVTLVAAGATSGAVHIGAGSTGIVYDVPTVMAAATTLQQNWASGTVTLIYASNTSGAIHLGFGSNGISNDVAMTLSQGIGGLIDSVNSSVTPGSSSGAPFVLDHAISVIPASVAFAGYIKLPATSGPGIELEVHNLSSYDQTLMPSAGTQIEGNAVGTAVTLSAGDSVRCRLVTSLSTWIAR